MGKCLVCKGVGTTKRRSSAPCQKCSAGVCANCGGTRSTGLTVPCLPCQGKGLCSHCRGTGQAAPEVKEPCTACKQTGVIPIPCSFCSRGALYEPDRLTLRHTIGSRFNPAVNIRSIICSNDGGQWQGYMDDPQGTRWPQEISKMYIIEGAGAIRAVGKDAHGPYTLQGTIQDLGSTKVVTLTRKRISANNTATKESSASLEGEEETWVGKFSEYLGTRCILGTVSTKGKPLPDPSSTSKSACFLLYNGIPCLMNLPGCLQMAHYYDSASQIFACPTCAICEDCQGTTLRASPCAPCHGTGTLSRIIPCTACVDNTYRDGVIGTGVCTECSGKGALDARKPCLQCGRKGRCVFCKGYTVTDQWTDESCAECEGTGEDTSQKDMLRSAILKATSNGPKIVFGPRNTLLPDSLATLEKLATAFSTCKHVPIEIEILTDSVGPRAEQTCMAQGQILIQKFLELGTFKPNRFSIRPKFSSPFRDIQFHPISASL